MFGCGSLLWYNIDLIIHILMWIIKYSLFAFSVLSLLKFFIIPAEFCTETAKAISMQRVWIIYLYRWLLSWGQH